MVRFPFSARGNPEEHARLLSLSSYVPAITLEGLTAGIDNVRHDVFLSAVFTQAARLHVSNLVARYGNVQDLAAPELPAPRFGVPTFLAQRPAAKPSDSSEFKRLLTELQVGALNRAKAAESTSIDLLARLAVLKFLRTQITQQFTHVLERCRTRVKNLENPRQPHPQRAVEMRERFAQLQINKRAILRKAGQELFETLREVEKETLARLRRSLFGEVSVAAYDLFLNRLLFTEDGRDDYLNAEHYVMLGNFERDPDRFDLLRPIACDYLRMLQVAGSPPDDERQLDALLNAPENAQELVAGGSPDESTPRGRAQKALLAEWLDLLERAGVMEHIVAAYECVPILPHYSPPINAQQLKNALILRAERQRVLALLEEHGKLSADALHAAVRRVASCRGADRAKMAGRFLGDFLRYHRDLRRLEAVNWAIDTVNVISSEKLRQLSSINSTLYEFLLPEELKPAEERITGHVILKADIRESTLLTRTLSERGLNPASYFSLNFYDPVNKVLSRYGATKVFIEGDAIILALFEHEGQNTYPVAGACVLAKDILEVVRGYNEQSHKSGLPTLDLGIGIAFQDSAPMYLMDGSNRIMISEAINQSDRVSSCTRGAAKYLAGVQSFFNVYAFQTVEDEDTGGAPDEFLMRYNVGGVNLTEETFAKLSREISLKKYEVTLPMLWTREPVTLYAGLAPAGPGLFHRIVVREGRTAHIDARDFSFKNYTSRLYYEVCMNPAIYDYLENHTAQTIPTRA
jgi:hypothetical protein